jgi:hypothetical protein
VVVLIYLPTFDIDNTGCGTGWWRMSQRIYALLQLSWSLSWLWRKRRLALGVMLLLVSILFIGYVPIFTFVDNLTVTSPL